MDRIGPKGWTALLALAMLVLVALPGSSAARSASALVSDDVDDSTRLFGETDVVTVSADWSDATLTVTVEYIDPPPTRRLSLLISDELAIGDARRCSRYGTTWLALEVRSDGTAQLELPTEDVVPPTTGAWDESGTLVVYSFSDPALARALDGAGAIDPFVCLSGNADGDVLLGAFDGRLLRIAPEAAVRRARAALTGRYGRRFTASARRWLTCPRSGISPASYDAYASASCSFRFRERPGSDRAGTVVLDLVAGVLEPRKAVHSTQISTRLARCGGLVDLRDRDPLIVDRELRATEMVGCGSLAATLIRGFPRMGSGVHTLVADGERFASFGDLARFRCTLSRSAARWTARCANKLGDGFVYGYSKQPRPRPKPVPAPAPPSDPAPSPSCDPSYSGACLDPNASDYDCAGGSGNGPLYTGTVYVVGDDHYGLDSDGDGVGCE